MLDTVQKLAAFSDGAWGGNPAGVWIGPHLPPTDEMQRIAAEVGYSETAFASPIELGWRVRYFAPAMEVPFCGHATIALGHALARHTGQTDFSLQLNDAQIEVSVDGKDDEQRVTLLSPETWAGDLDLAALQAGMDLFGLSQSDLHPQLRPALGSSGENQLYLFLHDREVLARMQYDFELGRQVMDAHGWMTVNLIVPESEQLFHARVAFAPGGVVEDPATGAAAAGLAEVLRYQNWPHCGAFSVHQGDDMGMPSRLSVQLSSARGSSVHVSGTVRRL